MIDYNNFTIVGRAQNYELNNYTKIKACYFSFDTLSKPILLSKENVKENLGDLRIFVLKYEKEIFQVATILNNICQVKTL